MTNDLEKAIALLSEAVVLLNGLVPRLMIPQGKTTRGELEEMGWIRVDENGIRYYEVREDGTVISVIRLDSITGQAVRV
jgi:hypothetical protein